MFSFETKNLRKRKGNMNLGLKSDLVYSNKNILSVKIRQNHDLLKLKEKLNFEKIINILKKHYLKKNIGSQVDFDHHARALILQLYMGNTYRGLVDQLNSNIYFRLFMNFDIDDGPRDHSAYVKFSNSLTSEAIEVKELLNLT